MAAGLPPPVGFGGKGIRRRVAVLPMCVIADFTRNARLHNLPLGSYAPRLALGVSPHERKPPSKPELRRGMNGCLHGPLACFASAGAITLFLYSRPRTFVTPFRSLHTSNAPPGNCLVRCAESCKGRVRRMPPRTLYHLRWR